MFRTLAIASATALLCGAAAAPANAQQSLPARSERVQTSDLDLNNPPDAQELVNRIDDAASDVCGNRNGNVSSTERRDIDECEADTTYTTVQRIGRPTVTAAYDGVTPEVIIGEDDSAYFPKSKS